MSITAAERRRADAHAGPGDSFPLYTSGAHLRAAWDLAGHAADPAATRARILAFARKHGLTKRLPKTAQKALEFVPGGERDFWEDGLSGPTVGRPGPALSAQMSRRGSVPRLPAYHEATEEDGVDGNDGDEAPVRGGNPARGKVVTDDVTSAPGSGPRNGPGKMAKAEGIGLNGGYGSDVPSRSSAGGPRVREMLRMAYDHAEGSGGEYGVIKYAQEHGIAHHLPERAHGFMHRMGMPHTHDGLDDPQHEHIVRKARNVVIKMATIEKAWGQDDGSAVIEGWVSTEDQDAEKDIVPPEAFSGALPAYAARCMPLSSEHNMKALPIGHGQQVALVRDGKVFAKAGHPTDAHDFEHFPGSGTGVYGRFLITDPKHADAVKKGNVGGFSFVGNLREYEPIPGGGRRFRAIDPWLESTVAAYPVNTKALLVAAKAYEGELPEEEVPSMDQTLEELLQGALAAAQREEDEARQAADSVTKADLKALMAALDQKLGALEAQVQKAQPVDRQGVGRVGAVQTEDPREADPASYIVKAMKAGDLSEDDQALAWGLSFAALSEGMRD